MVRRGITVLLTALAVLLFTTPAIANPNGMNGDGPNADDVANYYVGFRIVKLIPGEPSTPEVTLPEGYAIVPGSQYSVASRAEYYTFIQGPPSNSVEISVSWPRTWIAAVVSSDTRLPLTRQPGDPYRVTFHVAVNATSPGANQPTLQVWSMINNDTSSGVHWRIEHNDPDRAAGPWTTVPWPEGEAKSAINYLIASNEILQDSGLAAEARRRGHFFSLMGFETNNTLHADNPPHWHLAYYPGLDYNAPKAHVPHFWIDTAGRTFYNGMDIQGQGRSKFYVGDPAQIHDVEGNLIVTITIREDGGLDIDPPAGVRYSITPGQDDFTDGVTVLRDGQPWRTVSSNDAVKLGLMTTRVDGVRPDRYHRTTIYQYDPLTGVIQHSWPS